MTPALSPRRALRRLLAYALALALGTALWLPALHLVFRPRRADWSPWTPAISPRARALAARQLALWEDPARRAHVLARMRATNAEWDFMGRTFLVLALANLAERDPAARARYAAVADRAIEDTLALEAERGMYHFLMPYAHAGPFRAQPARSLFVDGEIALMLAARAFIEPATAARWHAERRARVAAVTAQMESGPVLSGESYPDECWTFCNTTALAAIRLSDAADGAPAARPLLSRWVATARARLLDARSGMLVSSYRHDGAHLDGPEGSSLFMSAHNLLLVDPAFAREQYALARAAMGRTLLGFGWAREWPAEHAGRTDVDSGPIVPFVEASAGASGFALLGASAFGDAGFLGPLVTSLEFAAFPARDAARGELRYAAGNQVADAVMLYALVAGPLWRRVAQAAPARGDAGARGVL